MESTARNLLGYGNKNGNVKKPLHPSEYLVQGDIDSAAQQTLAYRELNHPGKQAGGRLCPCEECVSGGGGMGVGLANGWQR